MEPGLSILNPWPQKLPGPSLLHELVGSHSNSNEAALEYLDDQGTRHRVSYQQLHDRSDALAGRILTLRRSSERLPEERFIIPMFIGQCPSLYITQLAILKAGGAFCPIPLDVPQSRLRFILNDASANLLLTTLELKTRLPELDGIDVLAVDQELDHQSDEFHSLLIEPSMPAYVMYTSGSTGQPKGVVLSHSAATQALLAHERHIPPFSRFLQFANPTFDVSVFEIFFPFYRGKTLICCERSRMLNDLPKVITDMEIDAAELTPSVANTLLRGRESVPGLKVLLTIGEMLKQGVVEDFGGSEEREAVLHGMYGPTEATIHCTLQPSFASDMPVGNIGVPLDTVSAFIVRALSDKDPNAAIEIMPAGEEGELAVGGHQLADGYLNRKEQTKAAFVSHPEYGRLYRTGDRARLDDNGRLICSGRISSGQVKLRGQRIELGEIEYAASRAVGCQTAVADVISGSLVVFCVSKSDELSGQGILRTCQEWLPTYMTPTDVHILKALPYLGSGKVDLRALREHHEQYQHAQPVVEHEELDEESQKIADVFRQVLRTDVSKATNLSSAGVDSLSAINVASKLRAQGFGQIAATDILQARELKDVRTVLDRINAKPGEAPIDYSLLGEKWVRDLLPSDQISLVQDITPCTATQVAMLGETSQHPQAYCNWVELQFDLQQSLERVELALQKLVHSHDMLRAGFLALDDAKHPYGMVTWRPEACQSVRRVQTYDYEYTIKQDSQLLHPRPIQVKQSSAGVSAVLQLHHAVYDQWSIDVVKANLDLLLSGQDLPRSPQFSGVVAYYAARHSQKTTDQDLDFWQDHLREAVATTLPQLSGQKIVPALSRTPWTSLDLSTVKLKDTAKSSNTSPHAIMQTAFAYLLAQYTGSADVLYGTVFSGRQVPVAGVEDIIGPCLATLPARCDLSSVKTLADLVRSVHVRNRSMLMHSETPLAAVKQAGQFAPDSIMFDTLFIWQESTVSKSKHTTELDSADHHEFRLVLEADPGAEKLAVRVTYQSSRIAPNQITNFVQQLQSVAICLIENPQELVTGLRSCLPASSLSIANQEPKTHGRSEGLVAVLEDVAQQIPTSTAVLFGNCLSGGNPRYSSLTYEELHQRANRLARFFISQGVKPDDIVCICMDKNIDLYVSILATLKAGAGYLPLVPETPAERIASATQQARTGVYICDSNTAKLFDSASKKSIIDVSTVDLTQMPSEPPRLPYSGSHAAYAIFTSGSTGIPKGLVVTVDNLLGNLATLADIYPVEVGDRMLQACSYGFDVSVFEIFFAFFKGMTLCSAPKDELFYDLEHSIRSFKVTHLSMTPTVAALVEPKKVPSVKFLVTAGEPLTETVHQRWAGKMLYQGYGPSETTNICTVNPTMPASHLIANIGPPFANTSAFVVDPESRFELLPLGAVGELAFGGEQVFRKYFGRDDLNAEKIIDHPKFGRVYRSGDIGRMLASGEILISGRLDDQVKIRGNRVELGEINAQILGSDLATDCTTIVLGKDAASQNLASFFIPKDNLSSTFEVLKASDTLQNQVWSLHEKLESSLPGYMVPSMIIPVSELPLTGQGKLDKRRLEAATSSPIPKVYKMSSDADLADHRDWNNTERILASALSETLGCNPKDIGRAVSFFAMGLNSIGAIVFSKKIARSCRRHAPVSLILRTRNITRLAQSLEEEEVPLDHKKQPASLSLPPDIVNQAKETFESAGTRVATVLPCTPLQDAMLSAGESRGSAYANKSTFRFFGDLVRLKQAFSTVVARHQILRTRFVQTSDTNYPFVQVVLHSAGLRWIDCPISAQSGHAVEADDVEIGCNKPFAIVTKADGIHLLVSLLMHHAIYDGASMSILLEEVETAYREGNLPPAPSFEPFLAEAQRHKGAESMSFWSSQFADYHAKPFPTRGNVYASSSDVVRKTLTVPREAVNAFGRRHAVNVNSILQAVWANLLSHLQRVDDICFGDVVSGRTVPVPGVDTLVAPCFNTVPVRARLDQAGSTIDLIRSLDKQRLMIDAHQLTPLRRIQGLSKTPSSHLFDSLMLVQAPSKRIDQSIWELVSDEGLMDLPLVLEFLPVDQGFDLVVHYETRYMTSDTAMQITYAFDRCLNATLRYPSSSLHSMRDSIIDIDAGALAYVTAVNDDDISQLDGAVGEEKWSTEETLVRQAFAKFSGVDAAKIGRTTSLFRLGLDSLSAVQVASHLRSRGGKVTAADVLEYRTPAVIARSLNQGEDGPSQLIDLSKYDKAHRAYVLSPLAIKSDSVDSLRPCTPAQNGMLAQSMQTNGKLYVNHITYAVPQGIDGNALRGAWEIMRQRHQALRMGFGQTEEARCPFVMIVYHCNTTSLPFDIQPALTTTRQEKISKDVVDTIHLPAWRLSFSEGDRMMTLSMHHALYDAESLDILIKDLSSSLRGEALEPLNNIDALLSPILRGTASTSGEPERFWRASLQQATPTRFPNLSPTVVADSSLGSASWTSAVSSMDFESLCRDKNCTVQAAGQTAWGMLLSAYTGDPGVTFGTVFSGRTESRRESIVFPALTTLPVFCKATKTSDEVLASMVDFNASAQRYRHVPLSDIQHFANCTDQDLFDTVFVYQKAASSRSDKNEWRVLEHSAAVDYNVSLELHNTGGGFKFTLTFRSSMIPEEHARLILRQYDHLLSKILQTQEENAPTPPDLYSITPALEPTIPAPVKLLHQFVERSASLFPDRPALEFAWSLDEGVQSRKIWTYRQLEEHANQVAHLLTQKGAKPGKVVAVCMHKSPEASFAFIGILKAGCAFLALDPELPEARRQFILKDSGAVVLLVDGSQSGQHNDSGIAAITLNEEVLDGLPVTVVDTGYLDPQSSCYCLYTSGTTGAPKGCELTHENAVQAMMSFQRLFAGHWNERSRWLQFASYWFDVSVLEQFWSWGVGITVIGAPRDLVLDDLTAFIQALGISHIDLTPSLARILEPEDVPTLWNGVFITGGEALKQEIIQKWGSHQVICNGYGPTEATIGVTMNPFVGPNAKPSNIGPQFDNVGSFVFAPGTTEPVLRGAVGELCVSGKLVGKGYLNREELTNKSFPTVPDFDERVYRTGDLVRQLADGSFSFIGRQDSQAKLRGQRLEIDEIDSVIKASSDLLADVASIVAKSTKGDKETLVSFFITEVRRQTQDIALDLSAESRQAVDMASSACRDHLPGYMVPTHVIPLNVMPLNVNNKTDAKRLAAFYANLSIGDLQGIKPAKESDQRLSEHEERIREVLSRMLSIDASQLTRETNLFSVGLSSVSAIAFAGLLKKAGFKSANVGVILRNANLGQLSDALTTRASSTDYHNSVQQVKMSMSAFNQRNRALAATRLGIDIEAVDLVAPCTPLQQGLVLESLRDDKRPYFNHFSFRARSLDRGRLRNAFQRVAVQTQVLRTKFVDTDDGHAQAILQSYTVAWTDRACRDSEVAAVIAESHEGWISRNEAQLLSPFEVLFMRLPQASLFTVFIHHALYDGISFDLLMEDVARAYSNHSVAPPRPQFVEALPYGPLRLQESSEVFWTKQLPNQAFQPLPARPTSRGTEDLTIRHTCESSNLLEQARREIGVSHQAVAQACFAIALHQTSPATAAYGTIVSGRSMPFDGADKVVGPLFNTIPVPQKLHSAWTWTDLVHHIHEFNTATIPYQHTPLRSIKKWTGRTPDDPMFDVLFVFQHSQASSCLEPQTPWESITGGSRAEYPLAFELERDVEGMLTATLVAKGDYFSRRTLQTLIDNFETALLRIAQHAQENINDRFAIRDIGISNGDPTPRPYQPADSSGEHDFTWTPNAEIIRKHIAQLAGLKESDVEKKSTMFSLGLDSIDAVKIASRLKRDGLPISVSKLIRAQTIPKILHCVERLGVSKISKPGRMAALERQLARSTQLQASFGPLVQRVLPATPTQEALAAEMMRSGLHDYYNHDVLRLSHYVDFNDLEYALREVVRSSPILRTSFVELSDPEIDMVFAQVVHQPKTVKIDRRSLSHQSDLDDLLHSIRQEVSITIQDRPPTRFTLLNAESERYLIVSLAHAQYDGHSLALIHEDIRQAYYAKVAPTRPSADSTIEDALIATDWESLSFWKNAISGVQVSRFPRQETTDNGNLHRAELKSQIPFEAARSLCQRLSVSLQSLAQMCWAITLAQYTKQLEVTFGVVLACRDSEEAEQIMFPMMNTVAMRVAMHGTREDMLRYVQSMNTDMLPYQRTPLRSIQNACAGPVRHGDAAQSGSLFDTIFLYQHRPAPTTEAFPPLYESVKGSSSVEYPVAVELEALGTDLMVRAACKDLALDNAGTQALLRTYDRVLQAVISSPKSNTVNLKGSEASFCDLPPIRLQEHGSAEILDNESAEDEADHGSLGEEALAVKDALCQVAKVAPQDISPSSTIESIGIDSISAIKVVAILRRKNIKLSVSQILRARNFSRIAQAASDKKGDAANLDNSAAERKISNFVNEQNLENLPAAAGLDPDNVKAILPTSAGQMYMLGTWMASGGQLFYPTFTYDVKGHFDLTQVRAAWEYVVQSREILRTVFCSTSNPDVPVVQAIMRKVSDNFVTDAVHESSDHLQPLFRMEATREAAGWSLRLNIHHALYDAVSLPLLIEDFQTALSGSELHPQPVSQAAFLAASVDPFSQELRRSFWTQYLRSERINQLSQPPRQGLSPRVEVFKPALLPTISALESLARKENLTLQSLLFATYARVYAQLAQKQRNRIADDGKDDVVLGIYLSNRSHLDNLSALRAPTLNLVPLLVIAASSSPLLDSAKQIQSDLQRIGSVDNSAVGLWQIHQWTGMKVDCFVNYQRVSETATGVIGSGDVTIEPVNGVMFEERAKVLQAGIHEPLRIPRELQGLEKVEAYQHSVDIEAKITEGKLDMGVFCPEAMLSLRETEDVCAATKAILRDLAV